MEDQELAIISNLRSEYYHRDHPPSNDEERKQPSDMEFSVQVFRDTDPVQIREYTSDVSESPEPQVVSVPLPSSIEIHPHTTTTTTTSSSSNFSIEPINSNNTNNTALSPSEIEIADPFIYFLSQQSDYHMKHKQLKKAMQDLEKLLTVRSDEDKKSVFETDSEVYSLMEEVKQLNDSVETIFQLITAIANTHREDTHLVNRCSKVASILLSILGSCHLRATTPIHKQTHHTGITALIVQHPLIRDFFKRIYENQPFVSWVIALIPIFSMFIAGPTKKGFMGYLLGAAFLGWLNGWAYDIGQEISSSRLQTVTQMQKVIKLVTSQSNAENEQFLDSLIELLALTEKAVCSAATIQTESKNSCPICYEKLGSKPMASPNTCNHLFHFDCLENWMNRNIKQPTCPMCRKVFERPAMYQ